MTTNTENQGNSLDMVKWGLAFILLAAAVIGNQMYSEEVSVLVRAIAVVVAFALAGFIALQTAKGKQALAFARESQIEVRKVVWPTRQEALNTTFIVLAATGILAVILWGLDAVLLRIVNFITGV
ncbi:preprotein translocase subunit SecE [Shewanella corallii]|uniref:Protein translocase subunit SecE n=2 Tax=Shewanella TaxID=22 RepID=A0ABT0NF87_9GAMM|nr:MULTISPECIES: preprotein translocase subunit SecE [Shewanella]MCL1040013.1 preprotein translocase subunit SecE [Shewanella submarina]MCL2916531.1 preprotein translocase subunit SecE [Shewanella corallii]